MARPQDRAGAEAGISDRATILDNEQGRAPAPAGGPPAPRWLAGLLVIVTSAGLLGLGLGVAGILRLGPMLVFTPVVAYTLWALWSAAPRSRGMPAGVSLLAVLLAAGAAVGYAWYSDGTPLALDDGTAQAAVSVAAADSGELLVDPGAVEYVGTPIRDIAGDGLELDCTGPCEPGVARRLVPQEARLATVFGTIGEWFGDDAAAITGPVLGGLAVLAFFGMASRWLRPGTALLAALVLAVLPVTIVAARTLRPDLVALLFAAGGLWALDVAMQSGRGGRGAVAGVILGTAAAASTVGTFAVVAGAVILADRELGALSGGWVERNVRRKFAGSVALGLTLPLAVAVADAVETDRLTPVLLRLVVPAAVIAALVLLAHVLWAGRLRFRAAGTTLRWILPMAAVGVVTGGLVLGTGEVPAGAGDLVARAAAGEGVPFDAAATYAGRAPIWAWWYLGPVGTAIGAAGVLGRLVGTGEARSRAWALAGVAGGGGSAIWLESAGVLPDAAVGLLPLAIPALVLGVVWIAERLFVDPDKYLLQTAAVVVVALLLAGPVWVDRFVWDLVPQDTAAALDVICERSDGDPVVIAVDPDPGRPDRPLGPALATAVAARCGVAAVAIDPADLPPDGDLPEPLVADRVLVVATGPRPLGEGGPPAERAGSVVVQGLEPTLSRAPEGTVVRAIVLGTVDVDVP